MGNKTNFELITPSQTLINQEVEMVVIPGSEGHFGVLPLHAHTLSTLNKGIVKLYENGNSINEIIVDGGIADVNPSGCTLLVEKADSLKNINKSEIEKRYSDYKNKENSFNSPIEEKANSEEIEWLKFVLESIK